ncbi:OLC1v1024928C1 [Oldenlandia corymbosa var. corymbosa]|uniref:OLC1v1024928C1 n=1 Tax=Oldenlandia corymbosa var. corymbosa TaxID=529605 RepID=A0AAV1C491_OLDCO|nr:OLC1v1024928C1 [Oldenlandia corymbosa var. corymbosa]
MGKVLIKKRSRPVVQSINVTAPSCNSATNSEVKSDRPSPAVQSENASASKEKLELAVQSKNVTVSSSNIIKISEVKSETPDPVVQSNNVPVSSSNSGTKYEVKSDPANQTMVMTTTESCSASENTGLTLCQDWVVGNCRQGPNDLVNAMVGAGDVLFAGVEDGSIMAWKSCPESSSPIMLPTLKGHTNAVISLTVGGNRLYSGSKDNTIRVWDLKTLECIETLNAHKESVTSLAFFDRYLLSGSLDNSLKVWGTAENGNSQVIYEMKQESGILALRRINDGGNKPILLCSCEDKIVRVAALPLTRHHSQFPISFLTLNSTSSFSSITSSPPPNNKLFVGGLSWSVDEKSLLDAFSSFGDVTEVRIMYDKTTGRSRGFGFVHFSKEDEAASAKDAMDGKAYLGRPMRVTFALDKVRGAPVVVPRVRNSETEFQQES